MSDAVEVEAITALILLGIIIEQSHVIEMGNLLVVVAAAVVVVRPRSSPHVDASSGRRRIPEGVFSAERRASHEPVPIGWQGDVAVGELAVFLVLIVDLPRGMLICGGSSGMLVVIAQIPLDMVSEAGLIQLTVVLGTEREDVDLAASYEMLCVGADQAIESAVLRFDDAAMTCFRLGRFEVMISSKVI